ncbi:unnamed protein product [Heterobilharzia americana]|nr:unnamed protein product [Heterobilharzia americana]
MPSPTRRRCGATAWKSMGSDPTLPNLKTSKTSLHPLLTEVSASSSSSSAVKSSRDTSASHSPASAVTGQKLRSKQTTTVRQRLAKRLGI